MPTEEDVRAYDERRSELERWNGDIGASLSFFTAGNSLALSTTLTRRAKPRLANSETALS
jgi:hypothetical protein